MDGTIGRDGVGEVVIKGPNVMRGYLNRPEDTARTVIGGWLHTGDVGQFDDEVPVAFVTLRPGVDGDRC